MDTMGARIYRSALMWTWGAAFGTLPAPPPADASPDSSMVFLGSFYSERFTEEHQYLNQIDLWREGEQVFGLTWKIYGLTGDRLSPTVDRFEGTLWPSSDSLILSNRFRGVLKNSFIIGASDYEPEDSLRLQKLPDRLGTTPARAPLGGHEAWRAWADGVIDSVEARDPYLRDEAKKCGEGDGWACLGIGNRLEDRKPEEARRYWERACELDAWPGCRFLGDEEKCHVILRKLCSSNVEPSLHRNMACQELGETAERAGKLEEAIGWYRLGCDEYPLPKTSCARLDILRQQLGKAKGTRSK